VSLPTDTLLARELHQAALAIIAARARGDAAALLAAQQRLASLSAAYRQAGHTEDELERAKAGGTIGGLIASITTLVRNAAVLAVLGIGFLLWLQYRSRES
jgi:hypothetical protein